MTDYREVVCHSVLAGCTVKTNFHPKDTNIFRIPKNVHGF